MPKIKSIMIYRKHSKIKFELYKVIELIKSKSSMFLLFSIFISGYIAGNSLINSEKLYNDINLIIQKYLFSENSIITSCIITFSLFLLIILLSTIFSFNIYGTPLIYVLPAISGILYSGLSSIILNYDSKNILIYFLLVFCPIFSICLYMLFDMFDKSQKISYLIKTSLNEINNKISTENIIKKHLIYTAVLLLIISALMLIFYSVTWLFLTI